jgi:hypothetical protein
MLMMQGFVEKKSQETFLSEAIANEWSELDVTVIELGRDRTLQLNLVGLEAIL